MIPPTGVLNRHSELPAVRRLFEPGRIAEHVIDEFINNNAFPLVAPGQVIFAWRGKADQVSMLRWIHGSVDRVAFERIPDTSLWLLTMSVQDGGRFEYKLSIRHHDDEHWIIDPLNTETASDPFGEKLGVSHVWIQPA